MKVVVIDTNGFLGPEIVTGVEEHGHEPVLVSAASGVDTLIGEGPPRLSPVQPSSSTSRARRRTRTGYPLRTTGSTSMTEPPWKVCAAPRRTFSRQRPQWACDHVALSVVGVERLQDSGCFRALLAREDLIRRSSVPYSVIRATQFFESAGGIADTATHDWNIWVAPVRIRPVLSSEVAALLAHTAAFRPLFGTMEIAGPDEFGLDTFIRATLRPQPMTPAACPPTPAALVSVAAFATATSSRAPTPTSRPSWATQEPPCPRAVLRGAACGMRCRASRTLSADATRRCAG